MRKRKLGSAGVELSVIGLGTWAQGGGEWLYGWGDQDDSQSAEAIHAGLDAGINWIDTAAVYGLGRAEEVAGKAVEGKRSYVFIATKCGRVSRDGGKTIIGDISPQSIRNECEASLRRLKTNYIDLYQIHWPVEDLNVVREAWTTMNELKAEGKIRFAGVSNFNKLQLEACCEIAVPASLQPPYSMLRRGIEDEILLFCSGKGIGIVAYSPMERGLLTGKFTKEKAAALPDNDHRKRDARFNEPQLSANLALVETLRPIAEGLGITLSQLSLAWVLRMREVTSAIAGARNPGQALMNAAAGDVVLDETTINMIESILSKSNQF